MPEYKSRKLGSNLCKGNILFFFQYGSQQHFFSVNKPCRTQYLLQYFITLHIILPSTLHHERTYILINNITWLALGKGCPEKSEKFANQIWMSIRGIPNQVYSAEHQLLDAALTCHKVTNFDGKVGVFLFLSDLETRQMRVSTQTHEQRNKTKIKQRNVHIPLQMGR